MTERPKMLIGTSDFRKLLTVSDVFVDKSLFIQEILDAQGEALLFTRPRRWGKSLGLDMLNTFLALEVDAEGNKKAENSNRVLFEGGEITTEYGTKRLSPLKIANSSHMSAQGQSPVIYLSFKDATATTHSEIASDLRHVVQESFVKYEYLTAHLNKRLRERFDDCIDGKFEKVPFARSLKFLTELLAKQYGKKVFVLVDEYDKPVNHFLEYSLTENQVERDKVAALVEKLLAVVGKDNPHLEKIVLTGIFDTLQKHGNSGLNNVKVYDISDNEFAHSFGFSDEEVLAVIKKSLDIEETAAKKIQSVIRNWYDGYYINVGNNAYERAYTPWPVVLHLSALQSDMSKMPKSYWAKSGVSSLLKNFIKTDPFHILWDEMAKLAGKGEISVKGDSVIESLSYGSTEIDDKKILYLLTAAGYITMKTEDGSIKYKIPNTEVATEFKDVFVTAIADYKKLEEVREKLEIITSYAQVDSTLSLYGYISDNDYNNVSYLLSDEHYLTCNNQSHNFSLPYITALAGNLEIFELCTNICTYNASNPFQGLSIADYAYMSGNKKLFNHITDHYVPELSLHNPGVKESIGCYLQETTLNVYTAAEKFGLHNTIMTVLGGTIVVYKQIWELSKQAYIVVSALSAPIKLGIVALAAGAAYSLKEILPTSGQYENYKKFNSIDISYPKTFTSFDELFKYTLLHRNAYVSFDKDCKEGEKTVTNIKIPLFSNKNDTATLKFPYHEIKFTLCEKPSGFIKRDSDEALILEKLITSKEDKWVELRVESYESIVEKEPDLKIFSDWCIEESIAIGKISSEFCYELT